MGIDFQPHHIDETTPCETELELRFRSGLVFNAHRLCVALSSRLQSNKEEEEELEFRARRVQVFGAHFSIADSMGGVPREQKMFKGHLPRVVYHQVNEYTKIKAGRLRERVLGR